MATPVPAMSPEAYRMLVIGSDFPPTLNTDDPPTDLKPGETPDGFGYDPENDGRLAKGTIPTTATDRVERLIYPYIAWAATTSYSIGDLRYDSVVTAKYVCHTAHTSAGAFDAGNWIDLDVDYGDYQWDTATAYVAGNIVVRDNPVLRYCCMTNHTSSSFQTDIANWQLIGTSYSAWGPGVAYALGAMVTASNAIYICKTAHTSAGAFSGTNWQVPTRDYIWAATKTYSVGDMVVSAGVRYACKIAHTASAAFGTDAVNWVAITTATPPCFWYYNRLWNLTALSPATGTPNIRYGAPMYDDIFIPQKMGTIHGKENTGNILSLVPFGADSLLASKATGSFIISNCSDSRALFGKTDLMQEFLVDAASHVVELGGVVYVCNGNGLFLLKDAQVAEVTIKARTNLSTLNLASQILRVDYQRKYIVGGSSFVWDAANNKLFSYVDANSIGSGFLYTSPQKHLPDWAPFKVDRFIVVIEHGSSNPGYLKYQIKFEDEAWSAEQTVSLPYTEDNYTTVTEDIGESRMVRKFQIRFTDLSSDKYVKEIRLDESAFNVDDYSA